MPLACSGSAGEVVPAKRDGRASRKVDPGLPAVPHNPVPGVAGGADCGEGRLGESDLACGVRLPTDRYLNAGTRDNSCDRARGELRLTAAIVAGPQFTGPALDNVT